VMLLVAIQVLGLLAIGRHDGREDAEGSVSGDWRGSRN
jgi:hypothetical protein